MASVGAYLRDLRTRRGVSLQEIARTTRIALRYLEALEADALEDLPAPVFIRGFIRAYCQALGESPQEALSWYDGREGRVVPPPARPAPITRSTGAEPRTHGAIVVSLVLLVVLGMALFTVALVIQPRDRDRAAFETRPAPGPPASGPAEPAPASPSRTGAAPETVPPARPAPTATATPPPAPAPQTRPSAEARPPASVLPPPAAAPPASRAAPPPAGAPGTEPATAGRPPSATTPVPGLETLVGSVSAPYRLVARTTEPSWIRVRTDDGRTSEETVAAGEVREWVSDRPFVLTIGNAGGVALELNGRALPSLGARGVVIPRLVLPPEPR